MKKAKLLTIVLPVFNEEKYIENIIGKVLKADSLGLKKEIIIVDDGSTDQTRKLLQKIREKNGNLINFIFKQTNEGKGAALKSGLAKSKGDIVLIQDSDLEYSPDDYPYLLEPFLKNDADVVYGSRFISDRPHRVLYYWHYLANRMITSFSNMLTNLNFTDIETGYKVFEGSLIRSIALKLQSKRFGFEPEITARIAKKKNIKIFEVGISYWGRTYEEGKKIGWKDGVRAVWEIIKYNLFTA